jgi:hypothetical protein
VLRRLRSVPRRRAAAHGALLLAGIAVALLVALPVPDPGPRCPPRGEGYGLCALQKAWIPTLLLVIAGLAAGHAAGRLLLVRLPRWRARRAESGERPAEGPDDPEEPPYRSDPFLLASTWGVKAGRADRRRRDPLRRLRRR